MFSKLLAFLDDHCHLIKIKTLPVNHKCYMLGKRNVGWIIHGHRG